MKIQNQLFVVALSGICVSCGTVPTTGNNNPAVAISTPDVSEQASPRVDSCESVSESATGGSAASVAPAPTGEVAPATPDVSSQFAHIKMMGASPVVLGGTTTVLGGRFVGDLVLDQKQSKVAGAGPGLTVIDGNLIVGDQCSVVGLTVTGDVIFRGNSSRAYVECLGQVLDYGMQNRH